MFVVVFADKGPTLGIVRYINPAATIARLRYPYRPRINKSLNIQRPAGNTISQVRKSIYVAAIGVMLRAVERHQPFHPIGRLFRLRRVDKSTFTVEAPNSLKGRIA